MTFDFKNASRAALKTEYNRIAQEIGDDQYFTKSELYHLPQVLADGEQILAFTSGHMDGHTWLITLTDRRVIFLDKGLIYGLKQTTIDLDKISAITGETGVFLGKIRIQTGARDYTIGEVLKKTVIKFINKTQHAIEAQTRSHPASPKIPDDLVSMLERLVSLRERGALSATEFEQQKARILEG